MDHSSLFFERLNQKGFQVEVADLYEWEDRKFQFSHSATQTTCTWKADSMHDVLEVELEESNMSAADLEVVSRILFHYLRKECGNNHHVMLWLAEKTEGNYFLPFAANGYDIHPLTPLESSVLDLWFTDYFSGQDGYYIYYLRSGNRSFGQLHTVIEQTDQVFRQLKKEDPTFYWEFHPSDSKTFPVFWKGFRYVISIDTHHPCLTLSFYKTDYEITFHSKEDIDQCYATLYDLFYRIYRANRLTSVFDENAYHFQELCKKMNLSDTLKGTWREALLRDSTFDEIEVMIAQTNHDFWRMERGIRMFSAGCDIWVFDLEQNDFHHFSEMSTAKAFALERFLQQKEHAFDKHFEQYINHEKSV